MHDGLNEILTVVGETAQWNTLPGRAMEAQIVAILTKEIR